MAFNGACNQCGQWGHKEADYYAKKHINGQALTPKEGGKFRKGNNHNNNSNNNNRNGGENKGKKQFQGSCNYCGKFSHKEADCHKKAADLKDGSTSNEAAVTAISNGDELLLMVQEI